MCRRPGVAHRFESRQSTGLRRVLLQRRVSSWAFGARRDGALPADCLTPNTETSIGAALSRRSSAAIRSAAACLFYGYFHALFRTLTAWRSKGPLLSTRNTQSEALSQVVV